MNKLIDIIRSVFAVFFLLFLLPIRLLLSDTKGRCKKCGNRYNYIWCKPCQIDSLKKNFTNWTSENKKIDDFIQEKQLNTDNYDDIVFEWIPYNLFNIIKEIGKDDNTTVYSATWTAGPLCYEYFNKKEWTRKSDEKVVLKCLNNSQDISDDFLNEAKRYSVKMYSGSILKIYGISQNPDTKDYIMVLHNKYWEMYCEKCGKQYTDYHKWCRPCQINSLEKNLTNWTSENKKIDDFIREKQLHIDNYDDIVFEWLPYDQFNDIKEIGKGDFFIVYTAIWNDGPLRYNAFSKYERLSNIMVTLKCLYNSQNILNEVKEYQIKISDNLKIYGISQNPDTKNYMMVLEYVKEKQCKKCKQYIDVENNWCKPCQIDSLKANFTNQTSGNEIVDNLIQQMQLKINNYSDIIFEWIPYDQFNNIKEIGKGGFATVYSAIWNDGLLCYNSDKEELIRQPNKIVALKCLNNSQNITKEFLNEINGYTITLYGNILPIYGISQNPDTKDYIMVLQYAKGRDFNKWMNINCKYFNWKDKISTLSNIINGLKEIHRRKMVHRDFHTGNILFQYIGTGYNNTYISDMGLCGEVDNIDRTKIYGVIPYVAPEVLRGNPYTQAADIYSFGMIMYFVATGKQPFSGCAHDEFLVLKICIDGIRPEINEPEAPNIYINLMKQCWDSNPDNRPNVENVHKLINLFNSSYNSLIISSEKEQKIYEKFAKSEEYRKANLLTIENNQLNTHPQAIYISQLLNPFTKDLAKYDDHSDCLDSKI